MAHPRLRPLVAAVATLAALSGCTPATVESSVPTPASVSPSTAPATPAPLIDDLAAVVRDGTPYLAAGPAGILVRYTKAKKSAWVL